VREEHLVVPRTARYFVLGDPGPAVRDVWIVCHGYGQLASWFLKSFEPIAAPDRVIVAAEALSRFYLDQPNGQNASSRRVGASWMTREDREVEIADQIAYLDRLAATVFATMPRDQVRLRVLGFSQGVATATRWVSLGAVVPDEVIVWAGAIPAELTPASIVRTTGSTRGAPLLTVVLGTHDEYAKWANLAEDASRFRLPGVEVRYYSFDGTHTIDAETLQRVARS
jgi:predicted esterase